jgi:hypothetical protein
MGVVHGLLNQQNLAGAITEQFRQSIKRTIYVPTSAGAIHVHPIAFSIPEDNIRPWVKKKRLLATLVPGDLSTYIFSDESSYYKDMSESIFALTRKKNGWDCMRHLEIMAAGAIPVFLDIRKAPNASLTLYPKLLFQFALDLYERRQAMSPSPIIDTRTDYALEKMLSTALSKYLLRSLTTTAMATYLLRAMNYTAGNVLVVSPDVDQSSDYLTDTLLHGLITHLGQHMVYTYHTRVSIYNHTGIDRKKLYGKGFSFCCRLKKGPKENEQVDVMNMINNKQFELVIIAMADREVNLRRFGLGTWRSAPYRQQICSTYPRAKVAILHGDDSPIPMMDLIRHNRCGVVFAREFR